MTDDSRTPPRTPSSALYRLNLQDGAKRRMREIAHELERVTVPVDDKSVERRVRILGEELRRLIDTL